jgi:CubicO group peptidase (beta-lactamase class C family)
MTYEVTVVNHKHALSKVVCAVLVALVLAAQAGTAQEASRLANEAPFALAIERFEQQLATDVEKDGIGGITAAVVSGDSVIWVGGFGWADRDLHSPAEAHTIYRTGSISKTFTAVLLMQLVDRGVVGLDDPVIRYLPEFAGLRGPSEQVASITLRQLASHTGGLMREPELENAAAGPIEGWESKVVASIPHTSLQSKPGSEYSYSNIGFGILGLTLSRAAEEPLMDMVEELMFQPLEMNSSTFVVTPRLKDRLSVGYANRRDGTINVELPAMEHSGRGYKVPNGGVYSTVADLGLFMAGMTGASRTAILSDEIRREMLTIQTPEDPARGYGLGLSIRTNDDGKRLYGHGGSVAGYTAYMLFEPESKLGVVLLRNYNSGETNLGGAAAELLGELVRASQ